MEIAPALHGTANSMSGFDVVAPAFDRHRALPERAAEAVRTAVLGSLRTGLGTQPRLLDLGAGSGRVGWPFVKAGDDYVGLDLSFGMLRAFRNRSRAARLVQADGCALPFADKAFDAVLLVQIFGGLKGWETLIDEALRVLRPDGAVMIGRTLPPEDGIDARMKRQLAAILSEQAGSSDKLNTREQAELRLQNIATAVSEAEAAQWQTERSPRGFLDRHAGGAQFSKLPPTVRERSLRKLADWAVSQFGSLDARFPETHRFTLRAFTFAER